MGPTPSAASGAKFSTRKLLPLAAETEMVVWVRNTFNPAGRAHGLFAASIRSILLLLVWKSSARRAAEFTISKWG